MEFEFGNLLNLPEEKIVEICQQMDDVNLARFLRVSRDTKRICGKILEDREAIYRTKVAEITTNLLDLPKGSSVKLQSTDPDRSFEIEVGTGGFFIKEEVYSPVFALQKIGRHSNVNMYDFISFNEIRPILLDLIHNGYITI